MDWIDIPIQVPWVEYQKLKDLQPGKSSTTVQVRMGDFGVRFLWFNGERLGETVTRAGPIVINTR